jgi:hypothetical protein
MPQLDPLPSTCQPRRAQTPNPQPTPKSRVCARDCVPAINPSGFLFCHHSSSRLSFSLSIFERPRAAGVRLCDRLPIQAKAKRFPLAAGVYSQPEYFHAYNICKRL